MEKPDAHPFDICERTALLCNRCIQVALALQGNGVCWEISKQLTRSGGSVGANVEEAQATTTKNDFSYRMSVTSRGARETSYWLKRIRDNDLLKPERMGNLIEESNEIVAILTSIVKKSRIRKPVSQ